MTFNEFWADIRSRLKAGTEIRAWSRLKGFTSLRFKITDVSSGSISVDSATMSIPRTIGKSDFERVYGAWPKYKTGKMSRAEMTGLSQNTTYIFGIIRWQAGP